MEDKVEEEIQVKDGEKKEKKNKKIIEIPSYQHVFDDFQSQPHSLFRPSSSSSSSSSFSDAFSFIKSSEFYTPPPIPPREISQQTGGPGSTTAPSSSSTSSPYPSAQTRNAILVSHRQKGNPLLKHIRNVKWMFADVVCDYLLGQSSCALYLSLRYHLLHPDYLYFRIRELQKNFKLRVVLCHVDVEDVVKPLLEITKTALLHDCTLLCGWSLEECGRYLETIKVYENKPADSIQERTDSDYLSRLTHALTAIRHVNKTDVVNLGSAFGSLSRIMDASMEDLACCPGIGERKVKRLYDTFHEPFRRAVSKPSIVPDASMEDKVEPSPMGNSPMEAEKKETATTKEGKEPSTGVRCALDAAFAKYSDKLRKKDGKTSKVVIGEEIGIEASGTKSDKGTAGEDASN